MVELKFNLQLKNGHSIHYNMTVVHKFVSILKSIVYFVIVVVGRGDKH